ncbi:MAG: hypothetical protein ACK4S4_01500 [Pyrinomonadaceae bacterium]
MGNRAARPIVYKWDGTTAYTTTEQKFNGRDQVLVTRQTDNTSTANPQTHQDVTMTYDGHGRMKTRRYPVEDAGAYTEWIYNPDDSIQQIIDPRLAITNFAYNSRGLTTTVSYSVPSGSSIPVTPTTTFAFDDLGNRTIMDTAGVSATTYAYDPLSRLTSETIDFDDLASDYAISYSYHIGGSLKSVTDPLSKTIDYTHDKVGRLTALTGSAFGDNTTGNYADNIQYRAFGSVKQMTYRTNDNAVVSMQYDSRLRVSQHQVATNVFTGGYLKKADFTYFADSRAQAMDNDVDHVFDREFWYDFAGRLSASRFGTYTPQQGNSMNPHAQSIQYDAFSNLKARDTEQWGSNAGFIRDYDAASGRLLAAGTGETLTYDASGNIVYSGVSTNLFQATVFDAAGSRTAHTERWSTAGSFTPIVSETVTSQAFDGDGRLVIGTRRTDRISSPASTGELVSTYYINSSVLAKPVTEIEYTDDAETSRKTRIIAGGAIVAEQRRRVGAADRVVYFHADPVTGSKETVKQSGERDTTSFRNREEYEPLGQFVRYTPPSDNPDTPPNPLPGSPLNDAKFPEWQCKLASGIGTPDNELPSHCKRAIEQDPGSMYTISWKEKETPIR